MRTYMYVIRYARTDRAERERASRRARSAGGAGGVRGRPGCTCSRAAAEHARARFATSPARSGLGKSALRWSFVFFQGRRLRALGFSQTTTTVKKSYQQIHAPLRQEQGFLLICSGGTAEKEDEAAVGGLADLKGQNPWPSPLHGLRRLLQGGGWKRLGCLEVQESG